MVRHGRSELPRKPTFRAGDIAWHMMVMRGVTILFGGRNFADVGDTWEWDGNIWVQRFPSSGQIADTRYRILGL